MKLKLFIVIFCTFLISANSAQDYIKNSFSLIPEQVSRVKLDIGLSYSAPQSQSWLIKEEGLAVFGFEPNPESVETIRAGNIEKKSAAHGEPLENRFLNEGKFHLMPFAVSNVAVEETMDFYVSEKDCGTSSLYKPQRPDLGPVKNIIKVPVISLKMFFDLFPWDRFEYIDYIKIDAQGSDLNILKSAGSYLSEKVVYVTAEADGYQYENASECSFENICNYMQSQGFEFINHPNTNDPTFINKRYMHLKDKIFIYQS